jgi:hypothetical protein
VQLAKLKAYEAEPGDGKGGAAASSTRGVPDMIPVTYDCGACGEEEEWHTWLDGWEGPCYEGKCERCYSSSAAVSKQQKSEAARDNDGWETQLVKLRKYMRYRAAFRQAVARYEAASGARRRRGRADAADAADLEGGPTGPETLRYHMMQTWRSSYRCPFRFSHGLLYV